MPVLHQVISIEKGVKTRAYGAVTEIHKTNQHPALFEGIHKAYKPREEGGEVFPPDTTPVQKMATEQIKQTVKHLSDLFDVTATRDYANAEARADVVLDGRTLIKAAPMHYLLFMEKQLGDLRAIVDTLPTLDATVQWSKDPNGHMYRAEPTQTHRTKKLQKALTLAAATDKHPAQAVQITDDEVVGYWTTTRTSGALPVPRKEELLDRIERLLRAVKYARQAANVTEAVEQKVGEPVFAFLFA